MFKCTNEIKCMFLNFFELQGHILYKSSSLIPDKDNSLLFTNAGMNQFKDIFLGYRNIVDKNIVTIQRCLRVGGKHNDLNHVGYTKRHHTFFEMMGNFSFNSYFKEEAILYAWKLLTDKNFFNISKFNLVVTVHINDYESYRIWSDIVKIPEKNIFIVGNKSNSKLDINSDNFWRMSDTGPCGYSTEIFYVNDYKVNKPNGFLNNNDNYLEIWNLVFIEYNIDVNKEISCLDYKCVDTGIGLERIASVLQNVSSNFDIDIFVSLKNKISKFLGVLINKDNIFIFNVISDHIRAIVFLIIDGLLPSNEFRGYILRKIIRRTISHIRLLNINNIFLHNILYDLRFWFKKNYCISKKNILYIKDIIFIEEKKFLNLLDSSWEILNFYLTNFCINKKKSTFLGKYIFLLYDTYGVPIDVIYDVCRFYNIKVDVNGFNKLLEFQKNKSRLLNNNINFSIDINKLSKTIFVGYKYNNIKCKILGIFKEKLFFKKISLVNEENICLLLNKTVFFPEYCGQSSDIGFIYSFNRKSKFCITYTKIYGDYILHFGFLCRGKFKINDVVELKYDILNRKEISCNHSALHLLLFILKNKLGMNIIQKGLSIKRDYFRFDFIYGSDLKNNLFNDINLLMNKFIWKNIVIFDNFKDKHKNINEKFFFIKNGSSRIVSFDYLFYEYCYGTHVNSTLDIGFFSLIDIYSVSYKIKRIKACTNIYALKFVNEKLFVMDNLSKLFSVCYKKVYNKILSFMEIKKKDKKDISYLKSLYISSLLSSINKKEIISFKGINFLVKSFKDYNLINKINDSKLIFNILSKIKYNFGLSLVLFLCFNKCNRYFIFLIENKIYKKVYINIFFKKIGNFKKKDSILSIKNKCFSIYVFYDKFNKNYFSKEYLIDFIKYDFLNF